MFSNIAAEMRLLVTGAKKDGSSSLKRLGTTFLLPVTAAAAAGAGGLYAQKSRSPPTQLLASERASFQCAPRRTLDGQGLPSSSAVDKALAKAGADLGPLRRAAARLRGPIERDLLAAELAVAEAAGSAADLRQRAYEGLVGAWRAAGYFAEPQVRPKPLAASAGINVVSLIDDAYGVDIGCEVPLCSLRAPEAADVSTLAPKAWAAAAGALEEHGVALARSLLSPEEVQKLRERLQVQVSALDRNRREALSGFAPVREYDARVLEEDDEDSDFEPKVSTQGRKHYYLRGRALEEAVKSVQAGAMPLVWEQLTRAARAAGMPAGRLPYVSEVQLLVTEPCAVDQSWHVDNTAPGLTLFVPLTDVPEDIGPTLFLPGTHHLVAKDKRSIFARAAAFVSSFLQSDGVAVGVMAAGDGLLYDSRIIHRGAVNRRYDRVRVALVFRYDFEKPPGIGVVGCQTIALGGSFFAGVQSFYKTLPGAAEQ